MTSPTTNYTAYVSADGNGWMIDIPAIERATYAAHLREVEPTAIDLIAIMTDRTPSASELTIEWPDEIKTALTTISSAKHDADLAQQRAMHIMADTALQLKSSGQSYRDIGAVLGISHQRVAQLLNSKTLTSRTATRQNQTASSA